MGHFTKIYCTKAVNNGYLIDKICFHYFRTENYQRCIDDVEAAFHYLKASGCHEDDYVLLDRKARCFMANKNRSQEALELFNLALESAASSKTLPDIMKAAFEKQVKANIDKLLQSNKLCSSDMELNRSMYDICLNKAHKQHPSMSSKLSINYSPEQGRGRYDLFHQKETSLGTMVYKR